MACCANLATIQKACDEGRATVKGAKGKLYLLCIDKVASIPAATGSVVSTDIVVETPGTDVFIEVAFDNQSGWAYDVSSEGEGQSKEYLTTINFFIPGVAATVQDSLDETLNGEFLLIFEDKAGQKRIVGQVDDGCVIFQGETLTDKNGYPCVATWYSAHKPYYYTGAIPT